MMFTRQSLKILLLLLLLLKSFLIGQQESDQTYQQLKILLDTLRYVEDNYVEEVDRQKLIYSAISGLLKPLDPYSQFMEPRIYEEMKIETEGQYGGLGIRITIQNDVPTVITPLPDTPAYRLGIMPGDKIIKIEGETTVGISLQEIVKKLRGEPGTSVTITVAREGIKEPMDITIVRELIKLQCLKSRILKDEIGYIHLYEFNQNVPKELQKTLKEFENKNVKSIIFDLRNNPGGLLDVAVEVVKFFIGGNKLIVYTDGRTSNSKREFRTNPKALYSKYPMVVIVNKGSASGSEIVAGALQDHKRALIIGSPTFGKASVQSIFPLPDKCALKLTTAKYYTPNGRCIEKDKKTGKGGIVPDVIIEVSPEIEAEIRAREEIYTPGKEEEEAKVKDPLIERAIEFLKARERLIEIKEE